MLLEKLKRAELNYLIQALPVDTDEFSQLSLFEEAFELALHAQLADKVLFKQSSIKLEHRANQEMLLLEEGHCLRGQALDLCFMAGATENSGFHASSLETLWYMVGEGLGMALIPELAVPVKHSKHDDISYIPFESAVRGREIGLLYRNGSYREVAFMNIQRLIQSAVRERIKSSV